jgi:hypothetical protein
MNHPSLSRAIFLAGMVFASGAIAGTDINKCVSPSGSVTLTDEPCPSGARTVKVFATAAENDEPAAAGEMAVRPTVERFTLRVPIRYGASMRSAPSRGLPQDVSTLKAARLNMHLFDNAAQALKSQRIAGLQ